MIFGLNANTRMKKLAGAIVLAVTASSVHAAIQVGGGTMSPAVGFVGNVSHRLNAAPDPGSFFDAYKTVTGTPVSYCQTGSGMGRNILTGASGTNVQNDCAPDFPSTVPVTGFGAATVGRPSLTQPDFAASDLTLSTGDFSGYVSHHGSGRPVQFPAVAASIAIAYNNAAISGTHNLTAMQVCAIFNGTITRWSQLGITGSSTDTMTIVYRYDGSGTSFGFGNWLSANCPASPAGHFITDPVFTTVVSQYVSAPGPHWVGANGNSGVMDELSSIDGAIGYAEAANAQTALGVSLATVNGKDPLADLGNPLHGYKVALGVADIVYNNAVIGVTGAGRPILGAIPSAPATSCIAMVKPDAYAAPLTGYPIITMTHLLGNSQGNGTDVSAVRKLLGAPFNPAVIAATQTIGGGITGLSFFDVSAAGITQSQIDSCVIN